MGCNQSSPDTRVSPENGKTDNDTAGMEEGGLTKERGCTDVLFLILLAVFVLVLIAILAYCMINGDIYRIINGYDDCGNICGRANVRQENLGCSGADRTNEEYLLVDPAPSIANPTAVHRMCVNSCENRAGYNK